MEYEQLELEMPEMTHCKPVVTPEMAMAINDIQMNDNRQAWLNYLYKATGRDDPSHPQHGVFSGLGREAHEAVGRHLMEILFRGPDFKADMLRVELSD